MPNDMAIEKSDLLLKLGAEVERVRPAPIVDQNQRQSIQRALESLDAGFSRTNLKLKQTGVHTSLVLAPKFMNKLAEMWMLS
jgi:cysteine synthase